MYGVFMLSLSPPKYQLDDESKKVKSHVSRPMADKCINYLRTILYIELLIT